MKRFAALLLAVLTLCSTAALGSCSNDKKEEKPTEATTAAATEKETKPEIDKTSLEGFYQSTLEGDNPLYGVWEISTLSMIKVIFRNDGLAETVIGTEGGFGKLTIDEKEKTLATQLVVGIDGTYKYSFSKDNNTLTLKNNDGTIKLNRIEYTMVPLAPKSPKVDKKLVGWWKNKDGFIYNFGEDGRMYTNMITTETYYTYSASNGKIKAVYDYDGDMDVKMTYSFKKNKLTIDGSACEPYNP